MILGRLDLCQRNAWVRFGRGYAFENAALFCKNKKRIFEWKCVPGKLLIMGRWPGGKLERQCQKTYVNKVSSHGRMQKWPAVKSCIIFGEK